MRLSNTLLRTGNKCTSVWTVLCCKVFWVCITPVYPSSFSRPAVFGWHQAADPDHSSASWWPVQGDVGAGRIKLNSPTQGVKVQHRLDHNMLKHFVFLMDGVIVEMNSAWGLSHWHPRDLSFLRQRMELWLRRWNYSIKTILLNGSIIYNFCLELVPKYVLGFVVNHFWLAQK